MRSLLISGSQAGGQRSYKLWVTTHAFPQAVFGIARLRTTQSFVRSLYKRAAQASAQPYPAANSLGSAFIHIIHNPNKSYSKGD